ncbi:TIGR02117 family protein [Ferrovibrio xuzhouensis]|uniref:TIGR02117 family protein n=1 Tax=Ferrovibrio xuzhouensis TaxID=1576914 RepID=A0ABV7VHL7_9PROT
MRLFRRLLLGLLALLLAIPGLYGLAALAFAHIHGPAREPQSGTETVPVYLISNGWHVWLALPVNQSEGDAAAIDWGDWLPSTDFAGDLNGRPYVAFGWGDRAFYLATRRPADFRLPLAAGALLGRGPAAMHVMRMARPDTTEPDVRRLDADLLQYHALAAYIRRSFATGPDGQPRPIPGAGYGASDAFYEAKGHYSPFRTCNEWVGAALRAAALPAGLWTPLPFALVP